MNLLIKSPHLDTGIWTSEPNFFGPHHNLRSSLKCHAQGKEMVKSVVEPIATLPTGAYPIHILLSITRLPLGIS